MYKKLALIICVTVIPVSCISEKQTIIDKKINSLQPTKIKKTSCNKEPLQANNVIDSEPTPKEVHAIKFHKDTRLPIKKCNNSASLLNNIPLKKVKPQARSVTIKNSVTKDMTGYTYLGTTYYPTFNIRINNQIVEPGEEITITTTKKTVNASYEYSFAKGLYKGKQTIPVDISSSNTKHGEVTFCWHDKKRIKFNTSGLNLKKISI